MIRAYLRKTPAVSAQFCSPWARLRCSPNAPHSLIIHPAICVQQQQQQQQQQIGGLQGQPARLLYLPVFTCNCLCLPQCVVAALAAANAPGSLQCSLYSIVKDCPFKVHSRPALQTRSIMSAPDPVDSLDAPAELLSILAEVSFCSRDVFCSNSCER
jgi:hypothetical protein